MFATATVNYHVRSAAPQAYHIDADGVAGKMVSPELVATSVVVSDLRQAKATVNFRQDGVTFVKSATNVNHFEQNADWIENYDIELTTLLTQQLRAKEVIVFDHTIRVDDPTAERRPARNVHSDYSPSGAQQRLIDLVGRERAADWAAGHYGFVNVWRPIENPIESVPLGFIRPSSVPAKDWLTIDLIYPDRRGEIMGLVGNTDHEWFYLSNMTPDEVVIFNIYDNRHLPSVAHSALDMQEGSGYQHPRKSIESRTLIRYY